VKEWVVGASLSDLENCVLGLPPLHLDRLLAWKRCNTVWEADVVGFGAVLYEMVVGEELPAEGLPARFPDGTSDRCREVLESIFRSSKPLPTVEELLRTNYLASVEMVSRHTHPYTHPYTHRHIWGYRHSDKHRDRHTHSTWASDPLCFPSLSLCVLR
jgi:hypothetical protein